MKYAFFNLIGFIAISMAVAGCSSNPQVFQGSTPIRVSGQAPVAATPPRVEIKDNRIVIHEKIQFEYDKAVIKEESFGLLNEIAALITKNSHIQKIRIEGHASSEGNDDYNLKLSQARAQAVLNYLVEKGQISPERLIAQGFGEQQPIADNATDEGREANRRVEFIITRQDVTTTKVAIDPKTGKQKVLSQETEAVSNAELKAPPAPQTAPEEDEAKPVPTKTKKKASKNPPKDEETTKQAPTDAVKGGN